MYSERVPAMWKDLLPLGERGSENGIVLLDEEYKESCRITLEKCPRCFAITCGVYGAMFHTAFLGENAYQETYNAMKRELAEFIDRDTTAAEEGEFYEYFTNKYR